MNSKFIVFILKVNIDGVDRYLADLQGTLSLSKTDAVLFKSRDRAYEFSKGIEGFYEETGSITTVTDIAIDINEWKSLHNHLAKIEL